MPDDRSNKSVGGIVAIAVAVLLFNGSLLFSESFEPFFIVGMLALFLLGLSLIARASAKAGDWRDPFLVRLLGSGKQETKEREHWLHVQTQRGRSIRTVILSILIGSLALFLLNHVTGSVSCSPAEHAALALSGAQTTETPEARAIPKDSGPKDSKEKKKKEQECAAGPLGWRSHADRLGAGLTYTTKAGDNLAGIALAHGISPSLLGTKNLAAVFVPDGQLLKALGIDEDTTQSQAATPGQGTGQGQGANQAQGAQGATQGQGTTQGQGATQQGQGATQNQEATQSQVKGITIEEVVRRGLALTPELVATRFATTPLEAGQPIKIPEDRPYDPRQWIDWMLWALIGMCAYLLLDVARHLRAVAQGEGDFLGETSWYWTQLATGPLFAFVILLLFVHIKVDLLTGDEAAFEVNLRDYPTDLLLVPAFLLGFYSRVTREVLDQLMRRIFAGAWRAANGDFEVVIKGQDANDNEVSSPVTFETKPPLDGIQWSATDGAITSAGVFTPPPQVSAPKQVFITAASPATSRSVVKTVTVVKHKFKITAKDNPSGVLKPGQKQTLTLDLPAAQEEPDITWELVPPVPAGVAFEGETNGKKEVVLAVPPGLTAGTVVVKATVAGLSRTTKCEITGSLD